jgi:transposase
MNQLKVNQQQRIKALHEQGWSKRKISRELALDRATVRKYLALGDPKSPTPHTGSLAPIGPASLCDPWRELIEEALRQGLSVQRIYQDLVAGHQFLGSYHSVRRFVRRLGQKIELPLRRMKCAPGQELQVDFGQGAWVMEKGQRRKTHLFRCVLSHSRKAYSEVVWRQTSESFIRCLENAFRDFGGLR